MRKNRLSVCLCVSLLALGLSNCGPASGPSSQIPSVVIAQASHSPSYASIYIAERKGFFVEEDLQVEFLRGGGGSKAVTILLAGDAQFALKTAEIVPVVHEKGIDLLTVQAITTGLPFQLIIRSDVAQTLRLDPNLTVKERLERVRGLTFATTSRGGASAIYTHYLLHTHGFEPRAHLDTVYMGSPPARKLAFQTGEAQLTTGGAENKSFLDSQLAMVLVDLLTEFPAIRDLPFHALHTRKQYAREFPDIVRKVIRALTRANQYIGDHPDETLQILQDVFADQLEPDQVAALFETQVLPVLPQKHAMTQQQWDRLVEVAMTVGILNNPLDTSEGIMWTNEFLDE